MQPQSTHICSDILKIFLKDVLLILEVLGPYGPLTSSPCGGLAHNGALWAPIACGAGLAKKKFLVAN